jgi:hypothetical protein
MHARFWVLLAYSHAQAQARHMSQGDRVAEALRAVTDSLRILGLTPRPAASGAAAAPASQPAAAAAAAEADDDLPMVVVKDAALCDITDSWASSLLLLALLTASPLHDALSLVRSGRTYEERMYGLLVCLLACL